MDLELFKKILSNLPTGVMVVTTCYEEKNYGLTVNSFTSLSLDPTLILFCIDKKSGSHKAFIECNSFVVNFLCSKQENFARNFASKSGDKFENIELEKTKYRLPILRDTMGYMVLDKYESFEGGDHHIIIGKVIDSFYDESKKVLGYYNRSFFNSGELNLS